MISTLTPRASRANRSGRSAATRAGSFLPGEVSAAITSAVIGASMIPWRWWPPATSSPSIAVVPITGELSGVVGRRPAAHSSSSSSAISGSAR